jgi:hypothetical protein
MLHFALYSVLQFHLCNWFPTLAVGCPCFLSGTAIQHILLSQDSLNYSPHTLSPTLHKAKPHCGAVTLLWYHRWRVVAGVRAALRPMDSCTVDSVRQLVRLHVMQVADNTRSAN